MKSCQGVAIFSLRKIVPGSEDEGGALCGSHGHPQTRCSPCKHPGLISTYVLSFLNTSTAAFKPPFCSPSPTSCPCFLLYPAHTQCSVILITLLHKLSSPLPYPHLVVPVWPTSLATAHVLFCPCARAVRHHWRKSWALVSQNAAWCQCCVLFNVFTLLLC